MVRAWVRDELQDKHHLRRDPPLSYIREKVLSQLDMNHTLSPPGSRTPRHHASMYAAADRAERVLIGRKWAFSPGSQRPLIPAVQPGLNMRD